MERGFVCSGTTVTCDVITQECRVNNRSRSMTFKVTVEVNDLFKVKVDDNPRAGYFPLRNFPTSGILSLRESIKDSDIVDLTSSEENTNKLRQLLSTPPPPLLKRKQQQQQQQQQEQQQPQQSTSSLGNTKLKYVRPNLKRKKTD
ncbi:hypothetical protein J6590_042743 [Homalodisca vitripennis]|nr:hypothetical protein J6590_042743 [Homalodisca vitripennis]